MTISSDALSGGDGSGAPRQEQKPFHLILTDPNMPGTDGFEFTERLPRDRQPDTTVMMLTSSSQARDAARCREIGVAYLVKPIPRDELRDVILKVLGGPRRLRRALQPASLAVIDRHSGQRRMSA